MNWLSWFKFPHEKRPRHDPLPTVAEDSKQDPSCPTQLPSPIDPVDEKHADAPLQLPMPMVRSL